MAAHDRRPFVAFVGDLPGPRVFTAHPVALDGLYAADPLFHDSLCLRSYAAAVTGRPVQEVSPATLPSEWFGEVPHTHRAIDDAVGYAHLLAELFRRTG